MATINETAVSGGSSRSTFINGLKDDYFPLLEAWLQKATILSSMIAKDRGEMGGKKAVHAVATNLPQSAGVARLEGWKMPTPQGTSLINPEIIARDLYWRLRWTGQVENAARKGKAAAWIAPRKIDMQGARDQFQLNFNRMLYLGPYDVLGVVASSSIISTVTVIVVKGRNARTSALANFAAYGTQYFKYKQSIQCVPVASGMGGTATNWDTTKGTVKEAIINAEPDESTPSAPTLTLDQNLTSAISFTPAAGDYIIPYASRRDTVVTGNESDYAGINGLNNMVLDSTVYANLFGLSKASNPSLSGMYLTGGGNQRQFSETYVELLMTRCRERSGTPTNKIMCSESTMREITKEHRGDRRFDPVIQSGGYQKNLGVIYGDLKAQYVPDYLCPNGIFYAIDPEMFGWYSQCPLQPIDSDDRFVPDYDSKEVIARKSGNEECERPMGQGAVDDFAFDAFDITM